MTCRHTPSMRERDDVKPRRISAFASVTAHDCLDCGELVYRVHAQPDLQAMARYNATGSSGPRPVSKTEAKNETLRLLQTLPSRERSKVHVRVEDVAA